MMGDSGFNPQDYVDFYDLDGLSDDDAAAIFAAICEDAETSNTQSDSSPSSSQEHNSIAQLPEAVTGASETPPVPEGAYCGICMESKAHNEFFDTNFCTHLYCKECVGSYVTGKVEDGMGWINCPEPGCESGFLDPEACRPVLPQGVIDRWGDLISEATIKVKFYCPYKNCSALLMDDQERGADEETSNTQSDSSPSSSQEQNSITQPPESVSRAPEPPPVPEGAYCGICMESKVHNEFFDTNFCTHLYCKECVGSYVTGKVEDGMGWINCPEPGCESRFLDLEACRPVLPQGVIDRWGDLICEATIKVKFYCPYRNCSALLMDDQERGADEEEDIITRCECPHCYRLFCAQCRSPWHEGLKCEEVQELGEGDREEEDLMLKQVAGSSKWQRCPECKFFVERNEGCNHITCRCKYEFCYSCGEKWKSSHYSCGAKRILRG